MPYLCAKISYRFFHGCGFQSWLLNVISARCGKGSVQTFGQHPRAPLTTPFLRRKVSNVTKQPLLSCPRPLDSSNRTIGHQWRLVIRLYNSPIRGVAQAYGTVRPIQIKTTCYAHIASFSCLGSLPGHLGFPCFVSRCHSTVGESLSACTLIDHGITQYCTPISNWDITG